MKKITLSEKNINGEWLLIENISELLDYTISLKRKVISYTERLLASKVAVDRWDHMITNTEEGAILSAVLSKTKNLGGRPLFEFDNMFSLKIQNMLKEIKNGKKILINSVGGYCTMQEDWKILSEKDEELISIKTYNIKNNTKYINIENDDVLEDETKKYLSNKDNNFSYILNLHTFSEKELIEVFKEFKKSNGQILYVYTTGLNIPQMETYIESAYFSGINEIELKITSEITQKHKEIFQRFRDKNVKITIL